MKILIIQENGRHAANRHMRECHSLAYWLEQAGASATCWGKGHKNFETPFSTMVQDSDAILFLENYNTGWLPEADKIKKLKLFWSIDSHCELEAHVGFCKSAKINIHLNSTPGYIQYFKPHVTDCHWFPNAVDSRWFYKKDEIEKEHNIGFVGSMIADRPQIIPFLNKTVGLESFTNIIGDAMVDKLNSFDVSFNKCIADDINYRIFESTACSIPIVTNIAPGLDQLYKIDEDILTYSNIKEMIGACQWLKNDELARQQVSQNGYKRTLENHTYKQRASLLMEIINNA